MSRSRPWWRDAGRWWPPACSTRRCGRGQDFELWLRLASRGARYRRTSATCWRSAVCAPEGLSGDAISHRPAGTDGARPIRPRARPRRAGAHRASHSDRWRWSIGWRLNRAKQRFLEGNFAAAQYHLTAARQRPLKIRLALLGLRLSPRLLRGAYLQVPAGVGGLVNDLPAVRGEVRTPRAGTWPACARPGASRGTRRDGAARPRVRGSPPSRIPRGIEME